MMREGTQRYTPRENTPRTEPQHAAAIPLRPTTGAPRRGSLRNAGRRPSFGKGSCVQKFLQVAERKRQNEAMAKDTQELAMMQVESDEEPEPEVLADVAAKSDGLANAAAQTRAVDVASRLLYEVRAGDAVQCLPPTRSRSATARRSHQQVDLPRRAADTGDAGAWKKGAAVVLKAWNHIKTMAPERLDAETAFVKVGLPSKIDAPDTENVCCIVRWGRRIALYPGRGASSGDVRIDGLPIVGSCALLLHNCVVKVLEHSYIVVSPHRRALVSEHLVARRSSFTSKPDAHPRANLMRGMQLEIPEKPETPKFPPPKVQAHMATITSPLHIRSPEMDREMEILRNELRVGEEMRQTILKARREAEQQMLERMRVLELQAVRAECAELRAKELQGRVVELDQLHQEVTSQMNALQREWAAKESALCSHAEQLRLTLELEEFKVASLRAQKTSPRELQDEEDRMLQMDTELRDKQLQIERINREIQDKFGFRHELISNLDRTKQLQVEEQRRAERFLRDLETKIHESQGILTALAAKEEAMRAQLDRLRAKRNTLLNTELRTMDVCVFGAHGGVRYDDLGGRRGIRLNAREMDPVAVRIDNRAYSVRRMQRGELGMSVREVPLEAITKIVLNDEEGFLAVASRGATDVVLVVDEITRRRAMYKMLMLRTRGVFHGGDELLYDADDTPPYNTPRPGSVPPQVPVLSRIPQHSSPRPTTPR